MTAEERLIRYYKDAYKKLIEKLLKLPPGASWERYYKRLLKEIEATVAKLNKAAANELAELVKKAYTAAEAKALRALPGGPFGGLNREAMRLVAENAVDELVEANRFFGRRLADNIRKIGLDATAEKLATAQTVREARRRIIEMMASEGLTAMVDSAGRSHRLDSYAELVARTTTREATNTATMETGRQLGYDLVKISTHYPTCEVCAPVQGRVFSVSGKDKRFPALSDVPGYDKGFKTIHPNCRHVLTITVEALWTDEERAKYLADARKPIRGDTRTQSEIDRYNAMQAEKRVRWQDRRQWEKYRARLGDNVPKTFSGFRNMKKSRSQNWRLLEAQYKDMQYYDKAVRNEPDITKIISETAENLGLGTAGLEYRVKSKDSYLRKIRSNFSPDGNTYEIKDILRYTFIAGPNDLVDKTFLAIDELEKMGYTTIEIKNSWNDEQNPYKGINTVVKAPNGQKFEIQYHTPESVKLKDGSLHAIYEKARLLDPKSEEFLRLTDEMFKLSSVLTVPDGIWRIRNKR